MDYQHTMAYNLMLLLIAKKSKTEERLTQMANVYYAAEQLLDDEYAEIMMSLKNNNQ